MIIKQWSLVGNQKTNDQLQTWVEGYTHNIPEMELSQGYTHNIPGMELDRKQRTALNRVRTGYGRCTESIHKRGKAVSPECDCGANRQIIQHIHGECHLRTYTRNWFEFLEVSSSARR